MIVKVVIIVEKFDEKGGILSSTNREVIERVDDLNYLIKRYRKSLKSIEILNF